MRRAWASLLLVAACQAPTPPERAIFPALSLHAPLFSAPQVLAGARRDNFGEEPRAAVLAIDEKSSLRAVDGAVRILRESGLSVAFWLDAAPENSFDGESRLAAARAMLADRPPADALFVPALQGLALPCGCSSSLCAATQERASNPRAPAGFAAALAGFARGASVIPVWTERGEGARACVDERCRAAGCAAREEQALAALREGFPHLALLFEPAAVSRAREAGQDLSLWAASRLTGLTHPASGAAGPPPGASIAVLPVRELPPEDLALLIRGVRAARRAGWVLLHAPIAQSELSR